MKKSSFEEFIGKGRKSWVVENKRDQTLINFPFSVIVTGYYPESDFAERWCWQKFGSPETEDCLNCHSDYPGCPLVLVTEQIKEYKWEDEIEYIKEYRNPGKHSHQGVWTTLWLAKTGYDFGYTEFCFKNEEDYFQFVAFIPDVTFGEQWNNEKAPSEPYGISHD